MEQSIFEKLIVAELLTYFPHLLITPECSF